ncbi:MAG: hypothetical protein WC494_01455 [Candidatus Pacearchaeota archaeon]
MGRVRRVPEGLSEESLARGFYDFLCNPAEEGGYRTFRLSSTIVRYNIFHYQVETNFIGSFQCRVEVRDLSRERYGIEELVGVPYDGRSNNSPNWPSFFNGIVILIKERLVNSK